MSVPRRLPVFPQLVSFYLVFPERVNELLPLIGKLWRLNLDPTTPILRPLYTATHKKTVTRR
jgi:hypothetical protein